MPPAALAASNTEAHTMRCLEVWGGNQAVNNGVVMAGLDAWLYSRPFGDHAAGGDIHFVSSCAAGMVTRVLIADVSGHGETVAGTARSLRDLMRRYVNYIDQTRLVHELNFEFGALSQSGGFATAVVATYIAPDHQLQLCNAGHPRPLLYRARSRQWSLLNDSADPGARNGAAGAAPSNTPLGVVQPACYDQLNVKLATGDLLILYTDSLIEARGDDGRQLGQEGLLQLIRRLDAADPGDLMQSLLDAIRNTDGNAAASDDVTILILRPNGLQRRVTLPVRLMSAARMTASLLRSLGPRGQEFPAPESGPLAWAGAIVNRRSARARLGTDNSPAHSSTSANSHSRTPPTVSH